MTVHEELTTPGAQALSDVCKGWAAVTAPPGTGLQALTEPRPRRLSLSPDDLQRTAEWAEEQAGWAGTERVCAAYLQLAQAARAVTVLERRQRYTAIQEREAWTKVNTRTRAQRSEGRRATTNADTQE